MPNPVTPVDPKPEDDIIEGLFADPKTPETPIPPVTPVVTPTLPVTPKEGETPIAEKVDVAAITKAAVEAAQQEAKRIVNDTTTQLGRQQQTNSFFTTEDGKLFLPYKETIEKAAIDSRFAALRVDQLPAAVLKPSAYAKVLTEAKAKADNEAKDGKMGGSGGRRPVENEGDSPDYANMPREEFKKLVEENTKKMKRR